MEVVGILDPEFVPPEAVTGKQVDLWAPFFAEGEETSTWSILSVVGRIKDGIGRPGAQAELAAFTENLAEELPGYLVRRDGSIRHTHLVPLQVSTFRSVSGPLLLLLWSVILMLLIACANVANLLLAHGTARARELALRGALGADRRRIVRQLLTESISLALVGGVVGVGLAFAGVAAFLRFNPGGVPRIEELSVDPRILVFAIFASLITGLVFGTVPALHASRKDMALALQEGGTASSSARKGRRTRSGLVVAEMALALVLLSGAGLFFRSLLALAGSDPGFEVENLVTIPLQMGGGYDAEQRIQFTRMVSGRMEALPGTQGVAVGLTVPFEYVGSSGCCISNDLTLVGGDAEAEPLPGTQTNPVTPGYFRTIGAEMAYGREFGTVDEGGDGLVAVINEPVARYFFGEEEALGRAIRVGGWGDFTVIGVTRGVSHNGIARGVRPAVYIPWEQWGAFSDIYKIMVRSTTDLETLAPALRQAIWDVDPNLPVDQIIPMHQRVEDSMAGQRFLSILLGVFAGIALLLASGGIYASMLYNVGQRKREMGIRLAMGAGNGELVRMVLKSALGLTLAGVFFGLGGAVTLSIILRSWLFGVQPADTATLVSVVAILMGSAFLASLVPALRAARTNVMETLTVE
jgi:predicted permease